MYKLEKVLSLQNQLLPYWQSFLTGVPVKIWPFIGQLRSHAQCYWTHVLALASSTYLGVVNRNKGRQELIKQGFIRDLWSRQWLSGRMLNLFRPSVILEWSILLPTCAVRFPILSARPMIQGSDSKKKNLSKRFKKRVYMRGFQVHWVTWGTGEGLGGCFERLLMGPGGCLQQGQSL